MRPSITTVIPTLGMAPLLGLCVEHLRAALRSDGGNPGDRIVVMDNATPDALSRDDFPGDDIVWIRFDAHHSFSSCCNSGMNRAPNPLYLMLNNDVVLHRDAVSVMADCLVRHPSVGIVGSRLVFPSGHIQHGGIRFGNTDFLLYHEHRTLPTNSVPRSTAHYQAVTGACMMIRAEVIKATGGFDEIYPFYFEDIDLCLRAREAGWHIMCCHEVDSIHFESMTAGPKEMNPEAKAIFLKRWEGRWTIDG